MNLTIPLVQKIWCFKLNENFPFPIGYWLMAIDLHKMISFQTSFSLETQHSTLETSH